MEQPSMQSMRADEHEMSELMNMLIEQSNNISKAIAENVLLNKSTEDLVKKRMQADALLIQTAFPTEWRNAVLDSSDRVLALLPSGRNFSRI